ncbi:MAG TPA: SdrD B-like domain-containing protein [Verrucomicrobiae bacterium]|jgi:hypothetical protein|nr:SdrD B-like domain-containing protein [Verrucomicrobiae bacterium]
MKKQLISKMALLSAMMIAGSAAFADPVIIISDGVTNTGPIVLTGGSGSYVNGNFDNSWDFVITTGQSKPVSGSTQNPNIELDITADSLGSGNDLTITISDNNFGPTTGNLTASFVGHPFGGTGDAISFDTYYDTGNGLAALTTQLTAADGLTPDANNSYLSTKTSPVSLPAGYSLTQVVTIKGDQAAEYSLAANLQGTNQAPSCNCTLKFLSPPSITLCAASVIPDIVAAQVCDGGLSNVVQVSLVGAVTNKGCPTIITRTNSAMDSCGTVYTFVQTVTINCLGNICGHVFADCDGSGDLTKGDVGLNKVTVSLLDASNKVVKTLTTDSNGGYCFTNLMGGNYTVLVTPPSGYSQTAASTSYHWKDSYGRDCWKENDGYIHCNSSGTECWWDKNNCCHWKDSYGRDCWKDNWGSTHCQPCGYQSCNAQTNNNKLCITLTNCTSQTDVDFAYTGTKACVTVSVCAPSYVRCGQTCTYTCTVSNTGNACFTGGTVCHQIGNCGGWGGWSNCQNIYDNCPPLSPGQSCTFTHKCTFSSWNCGTVGCQSTVNCNSHNGNCSGQSSCYSSCGW